MQQAPATLAQIFANVTVKWHNMPRDVNAAARAINFILYVNYFGLLFQCKANSLKVTSAIENFLYYINRFIIFIFESIIYFPT